MKISHSFKVLFLSCILCFATAAQFNDNVLKSPPAEHLIRLPLVRQSTEYTCGAAAVLSILGFYGEDVVEVDVAAQLGTNDDYGTDHKRIENFFRLNGFEVEAHHHMTLEELKNHIIQGNPVICLIQAWQPGIVDYSNFSSIGHYVIAVGIAGDHLLFMDPWLIGNYGYIPMNEFEKRWNQLTHENTLLNHWGLAVWKNEQPAYHANQPQYIP